MHCGYVVEVKELFPHKNADRLQLTKFFGNTVIVGLDVCIGDKGVYFPSDLQLSEELCNVNNLVRKKDENGKDIGGYLDPEKRNVKPINLRGERSDGIFLPIHALNYCFINPDSEISVVAGQADDKLSVGETITVVNGHEICKKYIPTSKSGPKSAHSKSKVKFSDYVPLFAEHVDTEQLAYNLDKFHSGDHIEITLKMHGTSQRTGYLPVQKTSKQTWWQKLMRIPSKTYYEYEYVCGTRRVVLNTFEEGGYYGNNEFREKHHNAFVGKLHKGETVYYEVVGFTSDGKPIMSSCDNAKTKDDEFVKTYGKTTVFSYGCEDKGYKEKLYSSSYGDENYLIREEVPQSNLYVYRMTMTTEEGVVIEYTPDFMRYRCAQMGVMTVPVFTEFILHDYDLESDDRTPGEVVRDVAERYYDGPDPVGFTHIREGVVVRIINRPTFTCFKHKNWFFKALEGIIKTDAVVPDIEESQEVYDV